MKRWRSAALVLLAAALVIAAGAVSRQARMQLGPHHAMEEMAYFPSGKFLRPATLGYRELTADFIWLRMIQYYGGHRMTDRKFDHLAHILDVLTTLDPKFVVAYTFGGLLLASSANSPQLGVALLDKGIVENPTDWRPQFTKGFIQYLVLRQYKQSATSFNAAKFLPGAPDMCARFAGFSSQRGGDWRLAREMWQDLLRRTKNEMEQEVATRSLREIEMLEHIVLLNKAATAFRRATDRWPDDLSQLLERGVIDSIPQEPFRGRYYFDRTVNRVRTTSYKFGLPWWNIEY